MAVHASALWYAVLLYYPTLSEHRVLSRCSARCRCTSRVVAARFLVRCRVGLLPACRTCAVHGGTDWVTPCVTEREPLHCTAQRCAALHCIALHRAGPRCPAQHCAALRSTALPCAALRCPAQHCANAGCRRGLRAVQMLVSGTTPRVDPVLGLRHLPRALHALYNM